MGPATVALSKRVLVPLTFPAEAGLRLRFWQLGAKIYGGLWGWSPSARNLGRGAGMAIKGIEGQLPCWLGLAARVRQTGRPDRGIILVLCARCGPLLSLCWWVPAQSEIPRSSLPLCRLACAASTIRASGLLLNWRMTQQPIRRLPMHPLPTTW